MVLTVFQVTDILPYDLFGGIVKFLYFLSGALSQTFPGIPVASWLTWIFALLISAGIILLFLWITKKLFLVLLALQDSYAGPILIGGILCITIFRFLSPVKKPLCFTGVIQNAGNEIFAVLSYTWDLFIWNFWWILVVILPVYFLYPEIREQKLWKHVVACFGLTVILRYCLEYCLFFTRLKNYSVFSDGIAYREPHFNFFYLAMIVLTLILAIVSYRVILYLERKVPRIHSLLSVES